MDDGIARRADRIAEAVRRGEPAALGRALSLVEGGGALGNAMSARFRDSAGSARLVGVTGPPGSGKSTLVDALIGEWRSRDKRVAVLAVDPVSPRTGGAVLGDRTRMGERSLDDDVFIRSVSARGHLGGLCAAARGMVTAMEAAGWDLIVLETVGAGQSETEVAEIADCTLVVSAPGLGDELQAIKAGILEIGNILVVNKCDRPGAGETARDLSAMLKLRQGEAAQVPVVQVSATTGEGIGALAAEIDIRLAATRRGAPDTVPARPSPDFGGYVCAGLPDTEDPALAALFRRAASDPDLAQRLLELAGSQKKPSGR